MSDISLIFSNVSYSGSGAIQEVQVASNVVKRYTSYTFHQNFMQPADAFTIITGASDIDSQLQTFLKTNSTVSVYLNLDNGDSRQICEGIIDQLEPKNSAEGSFIEIRGRSFMSECIDDGIDPWSKIFDFVEGQTFGHIVASVFAQYGLSVIYTSDIWARDIVTGVNHTNGLSYKQTSTISVPNPEQEAYDLGFFEGPPSGNSSTLLTTVTQWVDPTAPNDLEQLKIRKCKPEPHETAYQFVERHAKRFHQHIWGAPDGSGVIVGTPDYTQVPLFKFINRFDGVGNNVIDSRLTIDGMNMPNAIIATGFSGGGDQPNLNLLACKVNELTGYNSGAANAYSSSGDQKQFNSSYIKNSVQLRINRYKNLPVLQPIAGLLNYTQDPAYFNNQDVKTAIVYWRDNTSKTQAELNSAIQRRMSEFQRNALRLHIVAREPDQSGVVYRYNTIATITDEKLGIQSQNWWIEDIVFSRTVEEGTMTNLTLIPLNILSF